MDFIDAIGKLLSESGFATMTLQQLLMIVISCFLLYLGIVKKYEPLLLIPIAFGMLLTNLPGAAMYHPEFWSNTAVKDFKPDYLHILQKGGILDLFYIGIKSGVFPPLIFMGVGAMNDFGPLIANPKTFLLGAAAQFGIFFTFIGAQLIPAFTIFGISFAGFSALEAGAIGIIGGADGPTAIFTATKLAPHLLGAIAVAAYSYMALVPIIQPPIMKLFTTKKEREVVMEQLRPVSKREKIIFPIAVTILVVLFIPAAAPLVGMLMLGNLARESGVIDRLSKTIQNELINIVTILLGLGVGATATATNFLAPTTLIIILLGLVAFSVGTSFGVLFGKLMYWLTKGKINPLIGSAGVSAVPMAARVSQKVGQEANPSNYLLMHAMGPNVAGVIGSAVAAGIMISLLG
ncbi:MAG: sodium ion-translocating decarboxylase subunit beta [Clostridiales bacterium]|nr:sodium ion-translocating decarboxylase subunit beta [Clostridiales bacterium]